MTHADFRLHLEEQTLEQRERELEAVVAVLDAALAALRVAGEPIGQRTLTAEERAEYEHRARAYDATVNPVLIAAQLWASSRQRVAQLRSKPPEQTP